MIKHAKSAYHYTLSWLGNVVYLFPSRNIYVLGVTGTKGKSTTIELINAILEAANKKTALISSVRVKVDKETKKNIAATTMPGRFALKRFLRKAASKGCEYALVEVTSQGILQHRHKFIDFDAALITNLSPEHIEAHGSFENYRNAKASFFEYVAKKSKKSDKLFFINQSDESRGIFRNAAGDSGKVCPFSRQKFIEKKLSGGKEAIGDWLASNFNLENAAAAHLFASTQGIRWPVIKEALSSFRGVPGRMEYVSRQPVAVVVDYAHTPDSLKAVYHALANKPQVAKRGKTAKKQKLICVLGSAGGGRDTWKRPVMGEIAATHCHKVFVTDEDPYDEDPMDIINDVARGAESVFGKKASKSVEKVLDRKEAIQKAITSASKGDVVIITGKGSERWIHVRYGLKIPWSDRGTVEHALRGK